MDLVSYPARAEELGKYRMRDFITFPKAMSESEECNTVTGV